MYDVVPRLRSGAKDDEVKRSCNEDCALTLTGKVIRYIPC